jgi:hypothetical protein
VCCGFLFACNGGKTAPSINGSGPSNACVCGDDDAQPTADWFACITESADEPLTPEPSDACDTAGDAHYVTPTLTDMGGSVVDTGSLRHGSTTLVGKLTNPTGVAIDEAGNVFFGEVLSGPVRVILRKRAPNGTVTELGTVVDTSAGYVSEGWAFSVAVSAMGDVAYTTPVLTPGPGAEGAQHGSIRQLGGGELVGGLADEPAGLAFDGAGNLYFGTKDMSALRIQLHQRAPDGTLSNLGTVVESLRGVSTTWMFDLAVTRAGDVYFNTPNIGSPLGGPSGTAQLGSIRQHGGGLLVPNVSEPTGLAVDVAGNLYFGEKTFGPVRIQLKKRAPDGTITDLGQVVDTGSGLVMNSWPFDVAVTSW